jgi:dTDP-4-amino-4,6-dideoxygalactose transaminase
MRIYLSPPHLSGREQSYVSETLSSNWVAPVGPQLDLWEDELSKGTGIKGLCLVSSGTAAIHLSLRMAGVGKGDMVLIQSNTHIGSVNPIFYQGAEPIFIDSEERGWNMCPQALEKALKILTDDGSINRVKAIMVVHLYGMPAELNDIKQIADRYGVMLLEDAAESLGSTYNGKFTGGIGEMGIFSFNGNKIITCGGGGALVSKNTAHTEKALFLATQAKEDTPFFEHKQVGYNYRLSNVLAGVGRAQFKVLKERVAKRRSNFERYRDYFSALNQRGYSIKFQEESQESCSNRWLTCILVDPDTNKGIAKEHILRALDESDIEGRYLWKPMHLQPVFKSTRYFGGNVSQRLFETGLCLPSGSALSEQDFERIFSSLDTVFV